MTTTDFVRALTEKLKLDVHQEWVDRMMKLILISTGSVQNQCLSSYGIIERRMPHEGTDLTFLSELIDPTFLSELLKDCFHGLGVEDVQGLCLIEQGLLTLEALVMVCLDHCSKKITSSF